ncbi:hypothetical protein QZH41_004792 [Actinostola sp. cb2023]|nr:hypothetical protein QZH41_004792 [Actinostola sp. cb2023]
MLDAIDRRVNNTVITDYCDDSIDSDTWYRISGAAGNQIPTSSSNGLVQLRATNTNASQNASGAPVVKVTNVNIWKQVLQGHVIVQMSYGCSLHRHSQGSFIRWTILDGSANVANKRIPATCLGSTDNSSALNKTGQTINPKHIQGILRKHINQ